MVDEQTQATICVDDATGQAWLALGPEGVAPWSHATFIIPLSAIRSLIAAWDRREGECARG